MLSIRSITRFTVAEHPLHLLCNNSRLCNRGNFTVTIIVCTVIVILLYYCYILIFG